MCLYIKINVIHVCFCKLLSSWTCCLHRGHAGG